MKPATFVRVDTSGAPLLTIGPYVDRLPHPTGRSAAVIHGPGMIVSRDEAAEIVDVLTRAIEEHDAR